MKQYSFFLLLSVISTFLNGQNMSPLLRQADLSPDGNHIAYSFAGDIWMSKVDGTELVRLTVNQAYDSDPRFNQSGSKIAFTSNRFGSSDIFEIDLSDRQIRRKTYYDSPDNLATYDSKGMLYFMTRRAFVQLERESEVYGFEENLATPNRQLNATAMAFEPSLSNNGLFAFVNGTCRIAREAYRGPAQRDVWIYDSKEDQYTQITMDEGQDVKVRWSKKDIFILSARDGAYNIYKLPISDYKQNKLNWQRVTNVEAPGIRHFDVSSDGNTICYEILDQLMISNNSKFKAYETKLTFDNQITNEKREKYTSNLSSYSVSPNSKKIALEIHGEVFITENDKDKNRTVNISKHDFKDEKPQWLNDTTLLFISDRGGNEAIYQAKSADKDISDLFWTFKTNITSVLSRKDIITNFVISPKRDHIAVISEPGRIEIAAIDTNGAIGQFKTVVDSWNLPGGLTWSPDGKWIAYAQSDLDFNREVFVMHIDEGKAINVSMHPRNDYGPVWSPDGSKLAFISQRNNSDYDIWMAWLNETDYENSKKDWEEKESYPEAFLERLNIQKDTSDELMVKVDQENIHRRLVQVTSYTGNEGNIAFDDKGETIYFTRNTAGKTELASIKWNGEDVKKVIDAIGLNSINAGPENKNLFYIQKGKLYTLPIGKTKKEGLPFSAALTINRMKENQQVFDEAWRQLNTNFYDPNFHGQDFDALKKLYRPICIKANTSQDFRFLFNEMIGQINASHMGLYGQNPEKIERQSSGKLGAEYIATSEGLKISRIIPKGPLSKSQSKASEGDIIIEVNGENYKPSVNAYSLLAFKNDERVWLKLKDQTGNMKEIYPRCINSERDLLYDEWVDERRKLTEKYSNGKLGYIHVRGMNWPSFEVFERELTASGYGKDGILIDVRYNGGGWTTDMLMTVLNVRQHAYTVPRGSTSSLAQHKKFKAHYPYGERLPLSWWTKPAAVLCNSSSYSNAEIFSHAFKNLDRGPLVGEPTFGAVISTGGKGLMDGSFVRLPFRGWFVKESEKNMDFTPAVPDYIVETKPSDKISIDDKQLKKAVTVLLDTIDN